MHAVAFERVKDGCDLFRCQYLELVLLDRWRLSDGGDIAGKRVVLDSPSQRRAKHAVSMADRPRCEAFGYQRRVPLLDTLRRQLLHFDIAQVRGNLVLG